MSKKKVVVALGHEALGSTIVEQLDAVKNTAKALADLVEADYQLTITHMSQGYVGYDIQNSLKSELLSRGISKPVSTILTQVTVDPYDDAFYEPKKAIGRYMSKEDADLEVNKGNYVIHEAEGYRRVVAAPKPIDIVEIEAIKTLADADQVVIACGGGGIPVIEQQHILKGASAVIEKDSQRPITSMTVAEASDYIKEGQFGETDMLPKIQAAISYLEKVPGGKVIITSLNKTADAINEKVGTIITR